MDDLLISKVVKIKTIKMPGDMANWLGFLKDRFYTEHPYVPEDRDLNVVMERLDPATQTAVGYFKMSIGQQPYYVPIIIESGTLSPFDIIISADGKATAFIKEFYYSINQIEPTFGRATDRKGTIKDVTENVNRITKLSSYKDDGFLYAIIKRAGFNEYEATGVYTDGEHEHVVGTYKLLEDLGADNLMKTASVGEERILLPHSGTTVEILNHEPSKTRMICDKPGTYSTFLADGTQISGVLIRCPLNPGNMFAFIADSGYTFTDKVYGLRLSPEILLDSGTFTAPETLESILDVEGDPSNVTNGKPVLGYIYGSNKAYNVLIIDAITTAVHSSDGISYYIAMLPDGSKVGLVVDPNVASNVLTDISANGEAKGKILANMNKAYLIGDAFIQIPRHKLALSFENTKVASYKGRAKASFSIKRGQYIYTHGENRCVGDETMVKKAMAKDLRISQEDFDYLKKLASVSITSSPIIFAKAKGGDND